MQILKLNRSIIQHIDLSQYAIQEANCTPSMKRYDGALHAYISGEKSSKNRIIISVP